MDEILCIFKSYCSGVTNSLVAELITPLLPKSAIRYDPEPLVWYSIRQEQLSELSDLVSD